jgi:RND family efflux transporter MFP subunit
LLTRSVELGQSVEPGGPALFRLAEGNEIELRGEVAEQDLPALHVGQGAAVHLTGLSRSFDGHVRLLGAVIDPQTRLGTVRIALPADPTLRPGAFARAEVVISEASRSVLPQTAVLSDEQGSYVLLVGPDNKVLRRPVQVSGIVPTGVTISAGLEPGARVVATAGPFLQVGEVVKPVLATTGS